MKWIQLGEEVSRVKLAERERTVWDGYQASKEVVLNAARDQATTDQQKVIIAKLKTLM